MRRLEYDFASVIIKSIIEFDIPLNIYIGFPPNIHLHIFNAIQMY